MRTTRTKPVDDAFTAFASSTPPRLAARHSGSLSTTSRRGRDTRSLTEARE
jgi:hypothetical protein